MTTSNNSPETPDTSFWQALGKIQDFTDALTLRRILVAVLTTLLLMGTYTLYENRLLAFDKALSFFSTKDSPKNWELSDASKNSLNALVATNGLVKMIMITEVDLQKNRHSPRFWKLQDPLENVMKQRVANMLPQAVFDYDAKNTQQMVAVLNNEFVCSRFQETALHRVFPEIAKNTPVVCRIAIPPFYGRFVGVLTFGLVDQPTKDQFDALRIEAARISVEIYLRDIVKKPPNTIRA